MAKKPKVTENFKTPNEKFDEEFAVIDQATTTKPAGMTKPAQKPQA